jgi:hypothetical protein
MKISKEHTEFVISVESSGVNLHRLPLSQNTKLRCVHLPSKRYKLANAHKACQFFLFCLFSFVLIFYKFC